MIRRIKGDDGNASTIEMIIIILILFSVVTTVIDTGLYFNNRFIITNAAQNGAKVAAVYGGSGKTSIAEKYGLTEVSSACRSVGANNVVACSVYNELASTTSTVNTVVESITCGPEKTTVLGERCYCEIVFRYKGTAGSALSLVSVFGSSRVRVSAETEVIHKD